jgi:P27 family predicted phage terminase small subunit
MTKCPAWLTGSGRTLWNKLAPRALALGLLTVVDLPKFEAFCLAYGRWRQYERLCEKFGPAESVAKGYRRAADNASSRMASLGAAFGFDPSSRTGVKASGKVMPPDAGEAAEHRFFGGTKA